ncbi:hypothetical protein GCM10023087_32140 [Microbacterium rhizosphaerae]
MTLMHVSEDARSAEYLAIASQHITDGFAIAHTARIWVFGAPGPRIRGLRAANPDAGVPAACVQAIAGFAADAHSVRPPDSCAASRRPGSDPPRRTDPSSRHSWC